MPIRTIVAQQKYALSLFFFLPPPGFTLRLVLPCLPQHQ